MRITYCHHHGIEDELVYYQDDTEEGEWGFLHARCFYAIVGDPRGFLDDSAAA